MFGGIAFFSFGKKYVWLYMSGLLLLGVVLEIIQYVIPSRTFNVYDLLGNAIGVLCISIIIFLVKKDVKPK